ncbi:hypothetical protein [Butyrivibrio proteoclasticus]|uniref:hypothetical protein n=1 Tax=Butyrivibrio proteoclasticus TaxID=43305 RepID=UPI00047E070A|nr:hypothetical protein [Butyrivibrio proteoclasticus]
MSINRIDFGVIAATSEVSTIKAGEEARPLMDQQNFQAQFKEEIGNQRNSVNQKDDVGQGELHSDAEEKGSNQYMGDGGRNRRGSQNKENDPIRERQLSVDQMEKIAGNVLDRNGKPVDLHLSKGFDLKI